MSHFSKKILIILIAFGFTTTGIGQRNYQSLGEIGNRLSHLGLKTSDESTVSEKSLISTNFLDKIVVAGYVRSNFYNRSMSLPYDAEGEKIGLTKTTGLWDGYYDPFLFMYVGGDPTNDNSFGTEIVMLNLMNGPGFNINTFDIFNAMAVRGNIKTDYGRLSVISGGIEWRSLSKFTFGQNTRYNRFSVFERRPWDPVGQIKKRYASYYANGTLDQSVRFANRAFKGFLLHGYDIPYNLTIDLFYGKSMNNGGFERADHLRPAHNLAGKITKQLNLDNSISLNTYQSIAYTDTVNAERAAFQIYSLEYNLEWKHFQLDGEFGYGGYESPTYDKGQSPAIVADLTFPLKATKIPLTLRYYRIGKHFVNRNAAFSNSTVDEVNTGFMGQGAAVLAPSGGQITDVGDLVNNRQGFNINTEAKISRLKVQIGNEFSKDIENIEGRNTFTYNHRINGLTWSRFKPFPNETGSFGANKRVETFYRGAYEIVTIDSAQDASMRAMHYNALDVQLKFNAKIAGHDLYLFNLNTLNSIQPSFSVIPKTSNEAFIRTSYHELDVFFQVYRDLILDLYLGYERIQGNEFTDTELNDTGAALARDQTGKSFGLGLDFALSAKAFLFLRQRWFEYEDKNFVGEAFKGQESTIELKMFF